MRSKTKTNEIHKGIKKATMKMKGAKKTAEKHAHEAKEKSGDRARQAGHEGKVIDLDIKLGI